MTDLLNHDQEEEEWKTKLEDERARQNNKIIPKTNYQESIYVMNHDNNLNNLN